MSETSIAGHERRFDGWPTLPVAVGAYMPERDGDIAELEELAERVFDAVKDTGEWIDSAELGCEDDDNYTSVKILHFRYWPDDRAAEQLAIWRSQLDGIA